MSLIHAGPLGAALLALLGSAPPAPHRASGCDTDSPHAASFLAKAQSTFPKLDSAGAARLGWRTAPKSMALVTQAAKCDAIVAAHNAYVSKGNAQMRLTNAAIVQADGTYLVEVPPGPNASERVIFVYDTTLKFRVVY